MANTSTLKMVTNFAIQKVSKDLRIELTPEKVYIGMKEQLKNLTASL